MKALVLFSGGIDSTTALGLAIKKYGKDQVIALSVSYGQKHDKEIKAAIAVAQYYGVEHLFLDLSKIFQYSNCSLLQQSTEDIPEESYAEQISKTNGDKPVSTYVPFRNGLFLSSAASIALSKDCEVIYYGAHADDSAGFAYPDCSPVFNQAMNEAIWEGSGHQLKIEAPFVNVSKAEVVRIGLELGVPYELTWSCYEGGEKPCGKCGTCIDRAAAFQANQAVPMAHCPQGKAVFPGIRQIMLFRQLLGREHFQYAVHRGKGDALSLADELLINIFCRQYAAVPVPRVQDQLAGSRAL